MIPAAAWKYMVAKVRDQYPDTIFLLEGLGGKISVTRDLLNNSNLNWAYSELFQNYDRGQVENYLPEACDIATRDGLMVHFAETHDNLRLASRSVVYARMRTALCALCSLRGAFGFANGVEWHATEKINVHNAPSLNWGAETNQVQHIRRLNDLLKIHPVFQGDTALEMVHRPGDGNYICLQRHHIPTGKKLLVVANLDDADQTMAHWQTRKEASMAVEFTDLLSGNPVRVTESLGWFGCRLEPGQVLCLSRDEEDLSLLQKQSPQPCGLPPQIEIQQLRAKVLQALTYYRGTGDLADIDIDRAARQLKQNPVQFCQGLNRDSRETRVITWSWPHDLNREVMIPPGHFLYAKASCSFRARLVMDHQTIAGESSIEQADGSFFVLFTPVKPPAAAQPGKLKLALFTPDGGQHEEAPLLLLPQPANVGICLTHRRPELLQEPQTYLATNGRGGMLRQPVAWGKLKSRYDALLAANISRRFPEDRWIMFTRCRAWLVFQGFSQELNTDCLETFGVDDFGGGFWRYHIPTGQGENIHLTIALSMAKGENALQMQFYRHPAEIGGDHLKDDKPVELILRPDIENRNFHDLTKAYKGPEVQWPRLIKSANRGFDFTPDDRHHLQIRLSDGKFVPEPEWQYMIHHSVDAERGQDPDSDLFSPGYFSVYMQGNQQVFLSADIRDSDADRQLPAVFFNPKPAASFDQGNRTGSLREILTRALGDFVVQRGEHQSVIAGYPWFLDWGRDALIFVRGLIAARRFPPARAILKQFGQFEKQGTLPNMIRGDQADNRDTSDAPLWFILACAELVSGEKDLNFLEMDCSGRSIHDIVLSIVNGFIAGTPNGVKMDAESGLVFSPIHYTWMDTNYPAGTPRQGYPIEIQALWYAALRFLSRIDQGEKRQQWSRLCETIRSAITDLFWQDHLGYLSDCLHCTPGQCAAEAAADDALRPNQLLAITLGAIDDHLLGRRILAACETLLVPGAIRSLADRPVTYPIEVLHRGRQLNDPYHPYQGKYSGDEDTRRKPAYHNGTAWTWPFPSYCEAWSMTFGKASRLTALAWLASSVRLLNQGCIGHIPEILDGDFPHTQRGCDAQAWGAGELLRVWIRLQGG
jgi:predicted glycogen debranching enzyme